MRIIMLSDGSFVKLDDAEYKELVTNKCIDKEIKIKQSSFDILKQRILKRIRNAGGSMTVGVIINGFRSKRDLVINAIDELHADGVIRIDISYHVTTGNEIKTVFIN